MLLGLIVIILIGVRLAPKKDMQTYQGMSIEDVLENKYPEYERKYIVHDDYYYIWVYNKEKNPDMVEDIVYKNESGEYEFFSSNTSINKRHSQTIPLTIDDFTGLCVVYPHNDNYVLELTRVSYENEAIVFDKISEWGRIDMLSMQKKVTWFKIESILNVEHYFKVLSEVSDDYQAFVQIEGEEFLLFEGKEIKELFE